MKHILLVRHGLTDWSVQNRRLGSSDIPLNAHGERQAEWLRRTLGDLPIERVVSSDLGRAYDTATAIARVHNLGVQVDARLRERDHGVYEGSEREVEGGVDVTSQLDPAESQAAGVEDIDAVSERVLAAYRELRSTPGELAVLVSHYGPLRIMLASSLGLPPHGRRHVEMECGAFAVVKCGEDRDQLLALNVGGTYMERLSSLRQASPV